MARTDPQPHRWAPICDRPEPHPQKGCPDCQKVYVVRNRERLNANSRLWNKEHPERQRLTNKRGNLRSKGWTLEAFLAAVEAQHGRCFLCGEVAKRSSRAGGKPSIFGDLEADHCHTTGQRRHLLCPRCNRGLAYWDDDPMLLIRAILYVTGQPVEGALAAKTSVIDALLARPMTME